MPLISSFNLSVALHSPLEVLQERLYQLTGITRAQQELSMSDRAMIDPDRTLREYGTREGSVVKIRPRMFTASKGAGAGAGAGAGTGTGAGTGARSSSLSSSCWSAGAGAEEKAAESNAPASVISRRHRHLHAGLLTTPVTPSQSNHSYNGILFDVQAKGPHEVIIKSLCVGGMLGRVRVFVLDEGPWQPG